MYLCVLLMEFLDTFYNLSFLLFFNILKETLFVLCVSLHVEMIVKVLILSFNTRWLKIKKSYVKTSCS